VDELIDTARVLKEWPQREKLYHESPAADRRGYARGLGDALQPTMGDARSRQGVSLLAGALHGEVDMYQLAIEE